jgi:TPP-dependent pyruvate/acetoin dehydrogenase alpha subunit
VASLLRLAGHGLHDDASYVTAELKSRFGDCIQLSEKTLKLQGAADEQTIAGLWEDARAQIDAAVEQVKREPEPDAEHEVWTAYSCDPKKVRT